jgi:pentatricopeptide repeat protein
MKGHALGSGVEPNAYTYSALLKAMGDHGKWQMAEALFKELENEQLTSMHVEHGGVSSSSASSVVGEEHEDIDVRGESAEERIAADILVARTAEIALKSLDDDDEESTNSTSGVHKPGAPPAGFSYFSAAAAAPSSPVAPSTPDATHTAPAAAWTTSNAASRGLQFDLGSALNAGEFEKIDLHHATEAKPVAHKAAAATPAAKKTAPSSSSAPSAVSNNNNNHNSAMANNAMNSIKGGRGVVNEVVCGALMLAYERAGKWEQAVGVLNRAQALGITPNTVMYNTAVSALGKAGQLEAAEELFNTCPAPDAVTFETLIAAHGMAGDAEKAESLLREMRAVGHTPQDYAYCGIVAAYSLRGNWKAALKVKERAAAEGVPPSVHLFNALIAACDRARQYDKAIELGQDMVAVGITPNSVTQELLDGVCKGGVAAIENQQAAIAALSAAVAAAGTVMMRAGMF